MITVFKQPSGPILVCTISIWLTVVGCSSPKPPPAPPAEVTRAEYHARTAQRLAEQRNWPSALLHWQAAADQNRLLNRIPELASALHHTGQAHQHLSHLAEAEHAYTRAAELNTLLGRREDWWRNQIALLQVEALANTDRSNHFQQLLPLSAELKNAELAGQFLNELGLWQEEHEASLSDETFQKAGAQFRLANNHQGMGTALGNRARWQERARDYAAGAELWQQALLEFERAADPRGVTHALAGQGRCLAAGGTQLDTAKELLRRAAENYKTLRADQEYTNTVRVLEQLPE